MKFYELYDRIFDGNTIEIVNHSTGDVLVSAEDVYDIDDTFMMCEVTGVDVDNNVFAIYINPESV